MRKATQKQPAIEPEVTERPAPIPLIEKWAHVLCADDFTEEKTVAFLCLLDEIERADGDRHRIEEIVWAAQTAGFRKSDAAFQAMRQIITKAREENRLLVVRTPAKK